MLMSLEDRIYPLLNSYIAAPQWVKYAVGYCYRLLPPNIRMGKRYQHFDAVRSLRGKEAVSAYASDRLRETIAYAVSTVPAYSRLKQLAESTSSPTELLGELPFTCKADIKARGSHYRSQGISHGRGLMTYTGGSTSEPMAFALEKETTRAKEGAFIADFEDRLGCREADLTLSLRGRAVRSAARTNGALWMFEPIKRQLIVSCDHLDQRYMPAHMSAIERWRPEFIEAFASALYPLALWLAEHPRPGVTDNIRGVMLYSETVLDHQMDLFRRVFHCPIVKHYGHSERVLMGASMPDDERYFFWPQYGWLELIDSHGKQVTVPGMLGEIVGTSFDNRVMPFLRYRTGDLGILGDAEHPQLPGYPVLTRIEGRLQEFLVCRDHRLISITALGAAHFRELWKAESIQYEQQEPGLALLRVAALPGVLTDQDMRAIELAVKTKTQAGCLVRVERVDRIPRTPRGKQRMVIQHLDTGSVFGASPGHDTTK